MEASCCNNEQVLRCFNPENLRGGLQKYYRGFLQRVLRWEWESRTTERGTARTMSIFKRDKTFTQPIIWVTTLFMIAFHIGAFAALFFFTWKGLALAVVFWW